MEKVDKEFTLPSFGTQFVAPGLNHPAPSLYGRFSVCDNNSGWKPDEFSKQQQLLPSHKLSVCQTPPSRPHVDEHFPHYTASYSHIEKQNNFKCFSNNRNQINNKLRQKVLNRQNSVVNSSNCINSAENWLLDSTNGISSQSPVHQSHPLAHNSENGTSSRLQVHQSHPQTHNLENGISFQSPVHQSHPQIHNPESGISSQSQVHQSHPQTLNAEYNGHFQNNSNDSVYHQNRQQHQTSYDGVQFINCASACASVSNQNSVNYSGNFSDSYSSNSDVCNETLNFYEPNYQQVSSNTTANSSIYWNPFRTQNSFCTEQNRSISNAVCSLPNYSNCLPTQTLAANAVVGPLAQHVPEHLSGNFGPPTITADQFSHSSSSLSDFQRQSNWEQHPPFSQPTSDSFEANNFTKIPSFGLTFAKYKTNIYHQSYFNPLHNSVAPPPVLNYTATFQSSHFQPGMENPLNIHPFTMPKNRESNPFLSKTPNYLTLLPAPTSKKSTKSKQSNGSLVQRNDCSIKKNTKNFIKLSKWNGENVMKVENGFEPELSEEEKRLKRLLCNGKMKPPPCHCLDQQNNFLTEPVQYYDHLGHGKSIADIRDNFEKRLNVKDQAIRFEKLIYTGKEGKTSKGCPLAKWVIRRSGPEEKFLLLVKHRIGHHCNTAWIVVAVVAWEGVDAATSDDLYSTLVDKLHKFGVPTERRCAHNKERTCTCQGTNSETSGASFSFGCSWCVYYNGCKYARSPIPRKFRLSAINEESLIETKLQNLATDLAPLYKMIVPESYKNQTELEQLGYECRLGNQSGKPWTGVTACVDFSAHAHKDAHNMNNGCTVVATLTKHRGFAKPDDEQLHVLPLYILDSTDEFGNQQIQDEKAKNGSIEVLTKYHKTAKLRKTPLESCRKRAITLKEEKKLQKQQLFGTRPSKYSLSQNSVNHILFPTDSSSTSLIPKKKKWQKKQLFGTRPSNYSLSQNSTVNRILFPDDPSSTAPIPRKNKRQKQTKVAEGCQNFDLGEYLQGCYQLRNSNEAYQLFPNLRSVQEESSDNTSNCDFVSNAIVNASGRRSILSAPPFLPTDFESNKLTTFVCGNVGSNNGGYINGANTNGQEASLVTQRCVSSSFHHNKHDNVPQSTNITTKDDGVTPDQQPSFSDFVSSMLDNSNSSLSPDCPETNESDLYNEVSSDNDECFRDNLIGGVAIALTHGSVLFECAKNELHATTALKCPSRFDPKRISLVFYQHKHLNLRNHGMREFQEKMALKKLEEEKEENRLMNMVMSNNKASQIQCMTEM